MTQTPTMFTVGVWRVAATLLEAQSQGFRHADVAARLGPDFRVGGDQVDRLRWALKRLRAVGILKSGGHGVFVAGDGIDNPDALGAGAGMIGEVEQFFAKNGGLGRVNEMKNALALDESGERALHRVLEAGRYRQLPPLRGGRWWWSLPQAEVVRTPSPGWRLFQDAALQRKAAGQDRRVDLIGDVNQRRREIGQAVKAARERIGLSPNDLLTGAVGAEFRRCLESGRSWVLADRGNVRFSDWWRWRVGDLGDDDALGVAWLDFEFGQSQGEPCAADNLDAEFWRMLGAELLADAADLSRGQLQLAPSEN